MDINGDEALLNTKTQDADAEMESGEGMIYTILSLSQRTES